MYDVRDISKFLKVKIIGENIGLVVVMEHMQKWMQLSICLKKKIKKKK